MRKGRYGRLVPVGAGAALADAILAAPRVEEPRSRASDFSIERAVDGYLERLTPRRPAACAPKTELTAGRAPFTKDENQSNRWIWLDALHSGCRWGIRLLREHA